MIIFNFFRSPHGKLIYGFYNFQWLHDSNLTIEVLSQVLLDFKDKLPEVLYLQLDKNKNRFVLGYCALLVHRNVFKKVTLLLKYCMRVLTVFVYKLWVRVNFLPVGHTHEDIDQFLFFQSIPQVKEM